jgi:hypothetical protein
VTKRTILATQFELLDEAKARRWNHIATRLAGDGIELVLLSSNIHPVLELAYLEIPYPLSGYAHYSLRASDPIPDFSEEVTLEAGWQSSGNTEYAEQGAEQCWLFYKALLQTLDPDLVLAWNTLLPQSRILRRVCQQLFIPCQTLERGLLPGTWMMDPGDNHLENSLFQCHVLASLAYPEADQYPWLQAYRAWYQRNRPNKYATGERRQLDKLRQLKHSSEGLIVILSPVSGTGWMGTDSAPDRRSSLGFGSVEALLTILPEKFPGHVLAFRDHPINVVNDQAFVIPEAIHRADDASLADYLELADKVLVLGGTTALYEVMLHRKPFMVAGQCLAARKLDQLVANGPDDLAKLAHLQWQDCEAIADPLLEFLLSHYLIQIDEQPETGFTLDAWVDFLTGFPIRPPAGRTTGTQALAAWLQKLTEEQR